MKNIVVLYMVGGEEKVSKVLALFAGTGLDCYKWQE